MTESISTYSSQSLIIYFYEHDTALRSASRIVDLARVNEWGGQGNKVDPSIHPSMNLLARDIMDHVSVGDPGTTLA